MSKVSFAWLTSCILFGPMAILIVPFSKIAQAQSASSQVLFLNGVWEGSYTCRQGLTKLRLDIEAKNTTDINAVFSFSEHPNNPGTPSSRFRMQGNFKVFDSPDVSGLLDLKATTWINQPRGYSTVDLRGNVSSSKRSITGKVALPGCSTFEVVKVDTQNALQPKPSNQNTSQANRDRQLDGPESTVAKFHQAIQNRSFNSLDKYYCSIEKIAAQKVNSRLDPDGQNMALLNAYLRISSSIYSIDMSQLYYQTKYYDAKLGRAVVAITGNVIVKSPNGQNALFPYRRFGRDWLRLIKENNEWKLCHNLNS
ncbi:MULTISPECIES: hypothetical protein [Fischerella]|uniref:hypothetical protein n=1 Tax=Fischerella TaxID=1190 RepID=UPI0002F5B285|nr:MULTISPECIES: hypothetical protein [Fischerella]MBD2432151.1 hypothetical protein [Fischerella sp. FACHB-380]